jgi:hypothetical protein
MGEEAVGGLVKRNEMINKRKIIDFHSLSSSPFSVVSIVYPLFPVLGLSGVFGILTTKMNQGR